MEVKFYEVKVQTSGVDFDTIHFNDLNNLAIAIWHLGSDGFPIVVGCKEISKSEYNEDKEGTLD